jgi:predicted DCC family thiol-disulfide oxidoreductase YuxK
MTQLRVYFDGGCHLCSREIEHYRRADRTGRICFVDISAPGFDAQAEGLDPQRVQRELHVRTEDGALAVGVPAFIAIWRALPGASYRRLAQLAELPMVRPALRAGYAAFAAVRPYLPRREAHACPDGACAVARR